MKILEYSVRWCSSGFVLLCMLLLGAGCTTPKPKDTDWLKEIMGAEVEKAAYVLIIPNAGCTGCISDVETFVKENCQKMPQTLVLYSTPQSVKLLKIRLKEHFKDCACIRIDQSGQSALKGYNSPYPMLLTLEDGYITQTEIQSPDSIIDFSKLTK